MREKEPECNHSKSGSNVGKGKLNHRSEKISLKERNALIISTARHNQKVDILNKKALENNNALKTEDKNIRNSKIIHELVRSLSQSDAGTEIRSWSIGLLAKGLSMTEINEMTLELKADFEIVTESEYLDADIDFD